MSDLLTKPSQSESILLKGGTLITMDEGAAPYKGDLRIENGIITEIGPDIPVTTGKQSVLDVTGKIVMPAFYNLHLHTGETIFRGMADHCDLFEYLDISHDSYDIPLWRQNRTEIHALSSYLALFEAVGSGTGTAVISRAWEQVAKVGIRGYSCFPLIQISKLDTFYHSFKSGLSQVSDEKKPDKMTPLFIQSLLSIEPDMLPEVSRFLKSHPDVKLFIHIAETVREIEAVHSAFGCSPFEVLEKYDLLGPSCGLVHCVHLKATDYRRIKKSGAHVILCPVANLKLKSGVPDIDRFFEEGITLSISTDGLATNNSASLLESLKLSSLLTKDRGYTAYDFLKLITVNPSNFLKTGGGRLCKDAPADVAVFSHLPGAIYPLDNLMSHLLYNPHAFRCCELYVDGKQILSEERITGIKEREIIEQFQLLDSALKPVLRGAS